MKITANQSSGRKRPSAIVNPAGVCIQLFRERIQNVDNSVPSATISAAKKWTHCGTRSRPNSSTPRKPASRKNAVRPSYAINGPEMSAVASEKRLQLVPNWNGMTMPETTPMPNDTANTLSQNLDRRR